MECKLHLSHFNEILFLLNKQSLAWFASFNSNHLGDFSFFKIQYAICAPFSRFGVFLSTICAFIIHALQNAAHISFVTDVLVDYFLDPIGIIFREYCLWEVLLFLVPCIKMLFLLLIKFIFLCCRIKIISAYLKYYLINI